MPDLLTTQGRMAVTNSDRFGRRLRLILARVSHAIRSRLQIHPFAKDVALTAVTQAGAFFASFAVIALFGRWLGVVALGEYLMVRRVLSWVLSGAQLGLGVALARYVAHTAEGPSGTSEAYFVTALTCLGTLAGIIGLVLNLGRRYFAVWFFGDRQMVALILPISLLTFGLLVQIAVYGYYRGRLFMGRANALEFSTMGLTPLLAMVLLFRTRSVPVIVSAIGISAFCCSALFGLPIVRKLKGVKLQFWKRAGELLRYGVERVPGDFGGNALLALGPIIASHYMPLAQVSYLLLGTSVLMAVSIGATPLGSVLLAKVSMMLARGRKEEVHIRVGMLWSAVLELSTFACLQILVFSDVLMRLWVGPSFHERVGVIQIVVLGIPFYLSYVALRSIIDAAAVRAYNARNLLVSLAVYLVCIIFVTRTVPSRLLLNAIAAALLLALIVLACLTVYTVHRLFDVHIVWRSSVPSIVLSATLAGGSLLYDRFAGFRTGVLQLTILELVMGSIFLGALLKFKCRWLTFILNTTFLIPVNSRSPSIAD